MARTPPIRITRKDREEYRRLARNTQSKIRRVSKNYGIDLTDEIEIPKLTDFKTREEYNLWKSKQKGFTSRGNLEYQYVKNKYDVVISKKEKFQMERDTRRAQITAKKMQEGLKDLPFISGGKQYGTVEQRMLQVDKPSSITGIYIPPDFDFDTIQSRKHFEKKKESMAKRTSLDTFDKRNERMKENFIKLLESSFNSEADVLADKIRKIPPSAFYEMYLMYDEFAFEVFYTSGEGLGGEVDIQQINQMMSYVEDYNSGNMDFPFQGRLR